MTTPSFADLTISEIATTTIPSQPRTIAPVGYSNVDPVSSRWKRISTPMSPQPWHKQSLDGQWWTIADAVIHPYMFGNCGRGGDDSAAFQDCADLFAAASPAPSGEMVIPSGEYLVDGITFSNVPSFGSGNGNYSIRAYGAHIGPKSGGSAGGALFKFDGVQLANFTFAGAFLDEAVPTNHDYAISVINGSRYVSIKDTTVSGWGKVGGAAINIENSCYWTTIDNALVWSAGPNAMRECVRVVGECNNLIIKHSKFRAGTGGVCVHIIAGSENLANFVLIEGNDFEGSLRNIWTQVPNGDCPQGHAYVFNRHEATANIAHVLDMVSASAAPSNNPNTPLIDGSTYIGVNIKLDADPRLQIRFRD